MLLKDKIAIISGAASKKGIGLATARLFSEHGCRVAILDRDENLSIEAANSLGDGHIGIECDVSDRDACRRSVNQVIDHFGHVDILINNAGISQPLKIMEIEPANYDAVLNVNLRGTLYLSQAVIPHMQARRQGSIACTSSAAGQRGGGFFGGPHYSASKAGVLGLAKAMARELGVDGIRVNCVTPGLINTDITGNSLSEQRLSEIRNGTFLHRFGDPKEVAGAFLFLASDLSSYVTGAIIDVNGGIHVH